MRQSTSIHTRFEPDTWDGIEAYRRTQDAIPSRSRAVNDLVARALAELQAEAEKRNASLRETGAR